MLAVDDQGFEAAPREGSRRRGAFSSREANGDRVALVSSGSALAVDAACVAAGAGPTRTASDSSTISALPGRVRVARSISRTSTSRSTEVELLPMARGGSYEWDVPAAV
jgi:hypothetical protein